ncbi:uncharacterized protein LOC134259978 [Saccostrea cucullata]|uniref:uncharacterized protein LOC134259978 n=1 Tax=Saccostrea cuccullata TaxID=36930 RepID=UPI002ED56C76
MMFGPDNWKISQEVTPSKDNSVVDLDDSTDFDCGDSVYVSCINDNNNYSCVKKLSRSEIFVDNLRDAEQRELDHPSMGRNRRAREQLPMPTEIPSLPQETNQGVHHNIRTPDMCKNTCNSCASDVFSKYSAEYKTNSHTTSACSSSLDSIIKSMRKQFAHFYDASNDNWTLREANFFNKSLAAISEIVDKIDQFNQKYQTFVMTFNTHMINILMLNIESLLSNVAAFIMCSSSIQKSNGGIALYPEDLIQSMKVLIEQSIKTVNCTWMTFLQSTVSHVEGVTSIIREPTLNHFSPKSQDCEAFVPSTNTCSQKDSTTIIPKPPPSHFSPKSRDCEAFVPSINCKTDGISIIQEQPLSHSSPKARDCEAFLQSTSNHKDGETIIQEPSLSPFSSRSSDSDIFHSNESVCLSNVCMNIETTPGKTNATESEEEARDAPNMVKKVNREHHGQKTEMRNSCQSTPCATLCQQGKKYLSSDLGNPGIKECVVPLQRIDDSFALAQLDKRQIEWNRQSKHRKPGQNREARENSSDLKRTQKLSSSKGTQTPGKLKSFCTKNISGLNKTSGVQCNNSAKFSSCLDREIKKTMYSYSHDPVHQERKECDSSHVLDRNRDERNSYQSRKKLLPDFNGNSESSREKGTSSSANDQSLTTFVSFVRSYVCSPSSCNVSLQVSCVERNVLARKLSVQDTKKRSKNQKREHGSRKRHLNMSKSDKINTDPHMIKQRSSREEKNSSTATPRKRIRSEEDTSKVEKINVDKTECSRSVSQSAFNEVEKDNNNNFTRHEGKNKSNIDSVKTSSLQNEPDKMNRVSVNKNKARDETQNDKNSCSQGLKLLEDENLFFLNKQAELTAKIKSSRKVPKASNGTSNNAVSPSKLKPTKE